MKRINFHAKQKQIAWLKKLSKKEETSVAELIRSAIDDFIVKYQNKTQSPRQNKCGGRFLD